MARPDLIPFSDEHVDGAAALLEERHRRHREIEPLLPDVPDFRAQVECEWRSEGAAGAVAVDRGEVVGFVVGHRREDVLGPAAWVGHAGHAARDPELVRDLYGVAADQWLDAGMSRHFAFVPALPDLVEPWFQLSFGASAAQATRETALDPPGDPGVSIRLSTPEDLDATAALSLLLSEHLTRPPSFGGLPVETLDWHRDNWRTTWDEPEYTHFVAELDGAIVGHLLLYRRPAGDLRVPTDSIDLAIAVTLPQLRGSGVGLALTAHAITWAHEHGYPTMTTDWRMTNLEASRFWPRRGFRRTFLRVYRSIP